MLHSSKFFDSFGYFLTKYPDVDLCDLFSKGQIYSKRWLIDELLKINVDLKTVFICAGWYGTLATFLLESTLKIDKIRSFDINDQCHEIADSFNRFYVLDNWKFKASTLDILDMQYPLTYKTKKSNGEFVILSETPDTIINTSCEHIKDFEYWWENIPFNKLVVLQSNNGINELGHVNCVSNLTDFEKQTPMTRVLYSDKIEMPKFTRFMRIGYK